jgi:hypothetical protein
MSFSKPGVWNHRILHLTQGCAHVAPPEPGRNGSKSSRLIRSLEAVGNRMALHP